MTAAQDFAEYIRRSAYQKRNVIDLSSATTMSLWPDVVGQKTAPSVKKITASLAAYPFLHQRDFTLENTFIRFLRRWTGVQVNRPELVVLNGVYGGLRNIAQAFSSPIILVPELMHAINKEAFRALGKRVIEYPILLQTGAIDLVALQALLKKYRQRVAFVYLYHAKAFVPTRSYYNRIAALLRRYHIHGVLDLDAWYTEHHDHYVPSFPLQLPAVRKQCLTLVTMSKELGVPGLRIAYAIGPAKAVERVRRTQQQTLEMIPMTNRALATYVLKTANLRSVRRVLRARMNMLVRGLRKMGYPVIVPPAGVNLFLHVPPSYESSGKILPDHLFAFDVWRRTGILLRPGSLHGHRLNHWVRFVIGQPQPVIREALRRLERANLGFQATMPTNLPALYEKTIRKKR